MTWLVLIFLWSTRRGINKRVVGTGTKFNVASLSHKCSRAIWPLYILTILLVRTRVLKMLLLCRKSHKTMGSGSGGAPCHQCHDIWVAGTPHTLLCGRH